MIRSYEYDQSKGSRYKQITLYAQVQSLEHVKYAALGVAIRLAKMNLHNPYVGTKLALKDQGSRVEHNLNMQSVWPQSNLWI